jgi:tetratricopeptide (TPR) repeat protein
MRIAFPSFALAFLLSGSALAASRVSPLDDQGLAGENRYQRCLSLAKSNAREAVSAAEDWHFSGGGAPSLHCEALALVNLHRYSEAGIRLDEAAIAAAPAQRALRVALFDQAGNAWLLASQPQKAESSFNSALALSPRDEDILFDRARARAARKNWAGAEADLSALLASDSARADALVLRASARHAEGRKDEASADIARALQVYPNYPEALVERGSMKYEAGDAAGARADWQQVVRDAPGGDAGAAARQHLADMDAAAAKPAPDTK